MEFAGVQSIDSDYFHSAGPSRSYVPLHVEVALLDKTDSLSDRPDLYQVISEGAYEDSEMLWNEVLEQHPESFVALGEVEAHDKAKKQIYLSSGYVVNYRYLVTANAASQVGSQEGNLFSGLKTLANALKMEKAHVDSLESFSLSSRDSLDDCQFHETIHQGSPVQKAIDTLAADSLPKSFHEGSPESSTIYLVEA